MSITNTKYLFFFVYCVNSSIVFIVSKNMLFPYTFYLVIYSHFGTFFDLLVYFIIWNGFHLQTLISFHKKRTILANCSTIFALPFKSSIKDCYLVNVLLHFTSIWFSFPISSSSFIRASGDRQVILYSFWSLCSSFHFSSCSSVIYRNFSSLVLSTT